MILPDVRGLHSYFRELALRFAEHGVDAIAIDYFGRTAGIGDRDHGFEYLPHVQQTTYAGLRADIEAAAAHLREEAAVTSLFTTGFCMGGRTAFLTAGFGLGLAGVIGFYGWPTGASRNDTPAPADIADTLEGPILSIFGGADEGIGPAVRDTWEQALHGGGRRARDDRLRGRAALVLRPQGRGLRGPVGGRVGRDARLHPGAHGGRAMSFLRRLLGGEAEGARGAGAVAGRPRRGRAGARSRAAAGRRGAPGRRPDPAPDALRRPVMDAARPGLGPARRRRGRRGRVASAGAAARVTS